MYEFVRVCVRADHETFLFSQVNIIAMHRFGLSLRRCGNVEKGEKSEGHSVVLIVGQIILYIKGAAIIYWNVQNMLYEENRRLQTEETETEYDEHDKQ